MLGADLVEGVPDAADVVAVGAAGEGDAQAGRGEDFAARGFYASYCCQISGRD
jgi:hypothetical protein